MIVIHFKLKLVCGCQRKSAVIKKRIKPIQRIEPIKQFCLFYFRIPAGAQALWAGGRIPNSEFALPYTLYHLCLSPCTFHLEPLTLYIPAYTINLLSCPDTYPPIFPFLSLYKSEYNPFKNPKSQIPNPQSLNLPPYTTVTLPVTSDKRPVTSNQ